MSENNKQLPSQGIYYSRNCGPPYEDEIDLYEIFNLLWRRKWPIMGFSFLCTLIAVYVTLFVMPEIYTAKTVLQPSSSESQSGKLMGALGQFLPLGLSGGGDKSRILLNYLNSNSIKIWMIEKYEMLPRMFPDIWDPVNKKWLLDDSGSPPSVTMVIQRGQINGQYIVERDELTGLISISFMDEDPEFAAMVVTGITKELERYLEYDNLTDAKKNRLFIEDQLDKAREEVERWESQIPNEQITAGEILRETEAALAVYAEMRKQYELAKIEEAKQVVAFKVLDPPLVPVVRSSPKRTITCLATMMGSGFVGVFFVLFIDLLQKARRRKIDRPSN